MAHNIVVSGGFRYCSLCGEESTDGYGAVCKSALEQEKMKADAAAALDKIKADAAAALEMMRLATYLSVALITLAVAVFFFQSAVSWGDKKVDKVVTSLNAGFGKQRDGLGAVAAAVGVGYLARLGPDNYVSAGFRHLLSALRRLVHA